MNSGVVERWTVKDMIDALTPSVDEDLRGQVKQIYDYRNWVAHGRNPKRQPPARTDARTPRRAQPRTFARADKRL